MNASPGTSSANSPSLAVDHLVVAAASLAQGVHWCEQTLGVTPGPGGEHALMGTHNRLLSLASSAFPLAYLEIIAINPDAPAPDYGRQRWFGLDTPALQARLGRNGPQLIHWVARSTALDMHRWGLTALGLQVGAPVALSRPTASGVLQWQMLLRPDGTLLFNGALPTLIQWQGPHPAQRMPPSGLTLQRLQLGGLPAGVQQLLRLPGLRFQLPSAADQTPAHGPAVTALLETPLGEKTLSTTP